MDFETWGDFESLLYKLSEVPLGSKKDAYLFSPAIYGKGTTRRNANVIKWARWAALDVDDHQFSGLLEEELLEKYGQWNFVCYSTASSSIAHPKFRMVFPLTEDVSANKLRAFWYALNTEMGKIGDRQTKDMSRMYIIPATFRGSFNFIFSNSTGRDIDPTKLMSLHPIPPSEMGGDSFINRLPEEMVERIVQHRKDQSTNTSIQWSDYKDCPFVNKRLVEDYKKIAWSDNTGRYAMIYKIMVSIAVNAVRRKYPISTSDIVSIIRSLDMDTSNRYASRALDVEADRAIEFAYRNA